MSPFFVGQTVDIVPAFDSDGGELDTFGHCEAYVLGTTDNGRFVDVEVKNGPEINIIFSRLRRRGGE